MQIIELDQAKKEIAFLPKTIKLDYYSLLLDLEKGKKLISPLSKPLFDIYKGLNELKIKDQSGQYRIFYLIKTQRAIYVVHAYLKKTTQTITIKTRNLLLKRIKEINNYE